MSNIYFWIVKNLGNLSIVHICTQTKKIYSKYVMAYMCLRVNLLLTLVANTNNSVILIIVETKLNFTNSEIRVHPTEGPMLKEPVTPFT